MPVYIHKNNQQSGPFEEGQVREWLASGDLSPNDMAIRQGDTHWQPVILLFSSVSRKQQLGAPSSFQAGASTAGTANRQGKQNMGKGGRLLLVLAGLFALGIIAAGVAAAVFTGRSKTSVDSLTANSNKPSVSSNDTSANSANANTALAAPNYTELQEKLKEFAALKPPVKLEKNPMLTGKVVVVEQKDKDNQYSLRMLSGSELSRYGLSADRLAAGSAEIDTLVQIFCGKGKEIGRYGPRMAYVPAYSNVCSVSVIDYRASKTIAQKNFVNGKKPVKIYVKDDENEYVLDPPTADVEKYLSGLVKE